MLIWLQKQHLWGEKFRERFCLLLRWGILCLLTSLYTFWFANNNQRRTMAVGAVDWTKMVKVSFEKKKNNYKTFLLLCLNLFSRRLRDVLCNQWPVPWKRTQTRLSSWKRVSLISIRPSARQNWLRMKTTFRTQSSPLNSNLIFPAEFFFELGSVEIHTLWLQEKFLFELCGALNSSELEYVEVTALLRCGFPSKTSAPTKEIWCYCSKTYFLSNIVNFQWWGWPPFARFALLFSLVLLLHMYHFHFPCVISFLSFLTERWTQYILPVIYLFPDKIETRILWKGKRKEKTLGQRYTFNIRLKLKAMRSYDDGWNFREVLVCHRKMNFWKEIWVMGLWTAIARKTAKEDFEYILSSPHARTSGISHQGHSEGLWVRSGWGEQFFFRGRICDATRRGDWTCCCDSECSHCTQATSSKDLCANLLARVQCGMDLTGIDPEVRMGVSSLKQQPPFYSHLLFQLIPSNLQFFMLCRPLCIVETDHFLSVLFELWRVSKSANFIFAEQTVVLVTGWFYHSNFAPQVSGLFSICVYNCYEGKINATRNGQTRKKRGEMTGQFDERDSSVLPSGAERKQPREVNTPGAISCG